MARCGSVMTSEKPSQTVRMTAVLPSKGCPASAAAALAFEEPS
ncbi:MAG: hypothetical protein ACRDPM_15550 [Solirubrobacteraceae bacterium]